MNWGRLPPAIGDRFDFNTIGVCVYLASGGKPTINEIANPYEPLAKVATDCLDRCKAAGVHVPFLYHLVKAAPDDMAFRDLVLEVEPAVAAARPQVRAAVDTVVSEVWRARALLINPAVRTALSASIAQLTAVVSAVRSLAALKNLHDVIHQLFIRDERLTLHEPAADIDHDFAAKRRLDDFHENVRTCRTMIESALREFPEDDPRIGMHELWAQRFGRLEADLGAALAERNPSRAVVAVRMINQKIESQPSVINSYIVLTARELELGDLISALQTVEAAVEGDDSFANGIDTLALIDERLNALVAEHNLWQEADDQLTEIDALERFGIADRFVYDFLPLWQGVSENAQALAATRPSEPWAKALIGYRADVNDMLAAIETARASAGEDEMTRLRELLLDRYLSFRREARVRSFFVDLMLRETSSTLVEISTPITAVLTDLREA